MRPLIPNWYYYGPRKLNIIRTQIRNGCSSLAQDLHRNHVGPSPLCSNCQMNRVENSHHYFLECPKYAAIRPALIAGFDDVIIPCNINTIVFGSVDHDILSNTRSLDATYTFIEQSNRFLLI